MAELRGLGLKFVDDLAAAIFNDFRAGAGEVTEDFDLLAKAIIAEFTQYGEDLIDRRIQAIGVARGSTIDDVERAGREEVLEAEPAA